LRSSKFMKMLCLSKTRSCTNRNQVQISWSRLLRQTLFSSFSSLFILPEEKTSRQRKPPMKTMKLHALVHPSYQCCSLRTLRNNAELHVSCHYTGKQNLVNTKKEPDSRSTFSVTRKFLNIDLTRVI